MRDGCGCDPKPSYIAKMITRDALARTIGVEFARMLGAIVVAYAKPFRPTPRPTRASRICFVFAMAALGALIGTAHAAPDCFKAVESASGTEAVDARTLRLADGRDLRLAGIEPFSLLLDTSEVADAKLAARLAALGDGAQLSVATLGKTPDRYGRLPALVAVGEALVQETLVKEGLALAFANGEALPCFDRILSAEAEARDARRGFWNEVEIPGATPDALAARIGRFVIFQGTVLSVGTRPATTYLDFGRRWSEDFTVEIPERSRAAFGGAAELEKLAGSRIRARGFLVEKSGPMLEVRSPAELEVLVARP
jgi:endonuclease YncB( thermonuclease family)